MAIICMSARSQAEGLRTLLESPNNAVVSCLMGSGLMEDAGMFISDQVATVVGPGGWQVTVTGSKPSKARIDARDAAGRPNPELEKAFRAALDGCR